MPYLVSHSKSLLRRMIASIKTSNTHSRRLTSRIHQQDAVQHAKARGNTALIHIVRLGTHQPTSLLLPHLPTLSKQRPPKHAQLAHRTRTDPPRAGPNEIRTDASRRADEFHRDPRRALPLRQLRDERRDVSPVNVIPTALALGFEHEIAPAPHRFLCTCAAIC